jgi:hypothetical protein
VNSTVGVVLQLDVVPGSIGAMLEEESSMPSEDVPGRVPSGPAEDEGAIPSDEPGCSMPELGVVLSGPLELSSPQAVRASAANREMGRTANFFIILYLIYSTPIYK